MNDSYLRPQIFDEIDYEIIHLLKDNARISSANIAKTLGINNRTVQRKLKNLLNSGALRVTTICEPSAFGYNSIVSVNLLAETEELQQVTAKLTQHPAVCYLSYGINENEMNIQARFKSGEQITHFLYDFIKKLPGVVIKDFYFEANIIKNIDTWEPARHDFVKNNRISVKPCDE